MLTLRPFASLLRRPDDKFQAGDWPKETPDVESGEEVLQ